jgi:hypothetical protein
MEGVTGTVGRARMRVPYEGLQPVDHKCLICALHADMP